MTESVSAVQKTEPQAIVQSRATKRPRIDWIAYIYLLPALVILTVFHILPAIYALWISTQGGRIRTFRFIGLDNYTNALAAPEFWGALQNTIFYVIGTVPVTLALGLGVAYLLFQKIRGRGIYRAVYFMPHVISAVASAIVWAWVFNPSGGVANRVLAPFGAKIGPDPASINACTLGGILANNSSGMCCGVTENSYKTIHSMTIVFPNGFVLDTGAPDAAVQLHEGAPEIEKGLLEFQPYTQPEHERLARVLEATYHGSLDCPQRGDQRSYARTGGSASLPAGN